MKYRILTLLFLLNAGAIFSSLAQNISYKVTFEKPQTHYCGVEMQLDGFSEAFLDLKMPVWTPGSYMVREFSKNVDEVFATDQKGAKLKVTKVSKNTWRVFTNKSKNVKVNYQVYAFEASVRTSFIDDSHAYLLGTSVFMFVDKYLKTPCKLTIVPSSKWNKVSTGLPQTGSSQWEFKAADYDVLADSPLEIGNHESYFFTASGVPHEIAIYGTGNHDGNRLVADFKKIAETSTLVFGENPCQKYVFMIHNTTSGGGGLEHLNSTTVQMPRWNYGNESRYQSLLGLAAHEYFHLWNVKRLRPQGLGPFNYDEETYTRLLWVAEGITSYYDEMILRRAGYTSEDKFIDMMAATITSLENTPGKKVQTLSESSFDAWIKFYRTNENSKNTTVSYYNKGTVVAALLDLEIISSTNGTKNLDDVMKYLYQEFYKKQNKGYTEENFKSAVEKIAGKKMDDFFNTLVYSTDDIDYNKYFNHAGLALKDKKGKGDAYLGITTNSSEGKTIINFVEKNSPGWENGLNVNDEIIAINGIRVNNDVNSFLERIKPGSTAMILISRNGVIQTLLVKTDKNELHNYKIEEVKTPTTTQKTIYKKWLGL